MNQITREQAFDLAKYRYKLVDKEGVIYSIEEVSDKGKETYLTLYSKQNYISAYKSIKKIGTDFFILCRDLSQLTETIEHEGESFRPIDKIQKSADYHDIITICTITKNTYEWSVLEFEMASSMHFNLGFPQETVKPL